VYRDLFFYSKDTIFENGGLERMRIASTGNVGIGTTAPSSALEISQQLSASSTIDYPLTISSRDDNNTIDQLGGEGVGIRFRIAGNAATIPGDSLVGASIAAIRESSSDPVSNTSLAFFVSQNDQTLVQAVRILSSGNVGIGTTSPSTELQVGGNSRIGGGGDLELWGNGSNRTGANSGRLLIRFNDETFLAAQNEQPLALSSFGTNSSIRFRTGAATEQMRITSAGNVGIGTTSPSVSLDINSSVGDIGLLVRGSANSPKMLMIHAEGGNSTTDVKAGIGFSNHGGSSWSSQAIGSLRRSSNGFGDLLFMLRNNTNGVDVTTADEKMRITAEGNLGIGTTSPGTKLDVSGVITATGGNSTNWNTAYGWGDHAGQYLPITGGTVGGAVTINGPLVVNGTITENSSINLKENVKESEGNLDKVLNLRPVEYNKIGSQNKELGLIAEEVGEVYPEFVQYDENGNPIGVHYSRLTAALIGAVKELNQQIQELKKNNG
jgi:hypothetical protein